MKPSLTIQLAHLAARTQRRGIPEALSSGVPGAPERSALQSQWSLQPGLLRAISKELRNSLEEVSLPIQCLALAVHIDYGTCASTQRRPACTALRCQGSLCCCLAWLCLSGLRCASGRGAMTLGASEWRFLHLLRLEELGDGSSTRERLGLPQRAAVWPQAAARQEQRTPEGP